MEQIKDTYTTKTKSFNGLKRELLWKYKLAFNISTTTRVFNADYDDCHFVFNIEKPSRGQGIISYDKIGNNISFTFIYKRQ
jgi:hypothetical protein